MGPMISDALYLDSGCGSVSKWASIWSSQERGPLGEPQVSHCTASPSLLQLVSLGSSEKPERAVPNFLPGIQGGCGVFFITEFALPSKPIFSEVHLQASPAPFQPPSLPF